MSALQDPTGFVLSVLVEAQRGMSDMEIHAFLTTGEVPDLSQPPPEEAVTADRRGEDEVILDDDTTRRWLAGEVDIVAAFNPSQPRDDDGRWTDGPGGGSIDVPTSGPQHFTGEDAKNRGKVLDTILYKARKLATDRVHATRTTNGSTIWSPERDQIQRAIVNDVYARAQGASNDGKAIIMGGPMGAGKTTTLRDHAGIDLDDYLVISPDDMKDELASRGLVPTVPNHPELSPLELSTLIHEESMHLAAMLARKAYRDRKNVIWDISMGSPRGPRSQIRKMDEAGYSKISSIVVDVSPQTGRSRAYARYRQGLNDWVDGKGNGGRYVPRHRLDDQHDHRGKSWGLGTLEQMEDEFDAWAVYDNDVDGREPKLVDKLGDI